ncbi:MAG TPA: hypothetical protein VNF73_05730 [Candidatus Saccharimonadales bacterium]|nr:hypothetical protein [Candidatus Saccharimonadales bacterium]
MAGRVRASQGGRLEPGGGPGGPADGIVLWSVATGRRGRRWRATVRTAAGLIEDLLLEVDLDGRPGRLEVTTGHGMLTLHPEPDGRSAHGNVVTSEGVRGLAFPWSARHDFDVEGSWVPAVVIVARLEARIGVGEETGGQVLHVDRQLRVHPAERFVRRLSEHGWCIESDIGPSVLTIETDPDGLPVFAPALEAVHWPLEEPESRQ